MRAVARLQLQSWGEQCTAVRAAVELDSSDRTALQTADGGVQCSSTAAKELAYCVHLDAAGLQGMPSVLQAASSFCKFWIWIDSRGRRRVPRASADDARASNKRESFAVPGFGSEAAAQYGGAS